MADCPLPATGSSSSLAVLIAFLVLGTGVALLLIVRRRGLGSGAAVIVALAVGATSIAVSDARTADAVSCPPSTTVAATAAPATSSATTAPATTTTTPAATTTTAAATTTTHRCGGDHNDCGRDHNDHRGGNDNDGPFGHDYSAAATGRSGVDEDGQRCDTERRRHGDVHGDCEQCRPRRCHRCPGHRRAACRADLRVSHPEPRDLHRGDWLWDVGAIAAGASATLTVVATVVSPDAQTNTASVADADQFDPTTANNTASATLTPQQADLALTKTVSDATPNVGDTVTFTVTASNAGPDAATGVEVTDVLPAGLTFVSATPSQGTYTAGTGLWDVGAIAAGASATLTVVATVVSPDAQTNTASVADADQFDPTTANNTASATAYPSTGRSGVDEDGQRCDTERRRHSDVHGDCEQCWPRRCHRCPGHRHAACRADLRVSHPEPRDLHPGDWVVGCRGDRRRGVGDADGGRHRRLA